MSEHRHVPPLEQGGQRPDVIEVSMRQDDRRRWDAGPEPFLGCPADRPCARVKPRVNKSPVAGARHAHQRSIDDARPPTHHIRKQFLAVEASSPRARLGGSREGDLCLGRHGNNASPRTPQARVVMGSMMREPTAGTINEPSGHPPTHGRGIPPHGRKAATAPMRRATCPGAIGKDPVVAPRSFSNVVASRRGTLNGTGSYFTDSIKRISDSICESLSTPA